MHWVRTELTWEGLRSLGAVGKGCNLGSAFLTAVLFIYRVNR